MIAMVWHDYLMVLPFLSFRTSRQEVGFPDKSSSQHNKEAGSSSCEDEVDELDEQPLVRNRSRLRSSGSVEAERDIGETEVSNGSAFASAEVLPTCVSFI